MINALMFILLILTGISLHYSTTENSLIRFDISVAIHNIAALIVSMNFIFFVFYNIFSKNGQYYRNWRKNIVTNLWIQLRFYAFGIFKNEPHPFPINDKQKFNPLQKFAYVLAMYFGMPLLIISGLGLLFPEIIAYQVFGIDGLLFFDILHITMGFILSVFLIIHIYTCTLGDKPNTLFKSMVNGYHEEHE